jgi:hypothetical protein
LSSSLRRFRRDERGTALVTFTVMIAVILAFAALATDLGVIYWNQRMEQNAVDAGALAGARNLPANPTAAVATAVAVAEANGVSATEISAVPNNPSVTTTFNSNDTISISAKRISTSGLRYVDGGGDVPIGTSAAAIVAPAQPADIWPLALEQGDNCSVSPYCIIKQGSGNSWSGNFGWITLGQGGASTLTNNIQNGYGSNVPTPVSTPAPNTNGTPTYAWGVSTQTGNVVSAVTSGFGQLQAWDQQEMCQNGQSCSYLYQLGDSSWNPWDQVRQNYICITDTRCPRVGIIPIISQQWASLNGNSNVTIVGFQCFYFESYDNGQGNGSVAIVARPLPQCYAGIGIGGSYDYGSGLGSTGSYGVALWR